MIADGVRRLWWAIKHGQVWEHGVSEEALTRMRAEVSELERADETSVDTLWFRNRFRRFCALVPATVPAERIPGEVARIIGNPWVNAGVAELLLAPTTEGQLTPEQTRDAGVLLRGGETSAVVVAAQLGVGRTPVESLAAWMGSREAQEEALRAHAFDYLERGETTIAGFHAETGIGLRPAKRILFEVQAEMREAELV